MIDFNKNGVTVRASSDADPAALARFAHWLCEGGSPVTLDVLATKIEVFMPRSMATVSQIAATAAEIKAAIDKRTAA